MSKKLPSLPACRRQVFSTKEVCSVLGVSRYTIIRLVKNGVLHPIPGFGHLRFAIAEVSELLNQRRSPRKSQRTRRP